MECPVTVGQVIGAKYRVDRVLATGGMGVVVEARHLELEQQVAIKFLRTEGIDTEAAAARLRREARVAARIRSQHAARVFDVGVLSSNVPYMVMEYLEGNDLADELAMRTRLPIAEAVLYVLQAIEALAEAHAAGIVHRDLKPENIFLAQRPDGTRTVKLLDFGISKWVTPGSISDFALNQSAILGSPPYMSPEQLRAADSVDHRADVWSLGTILYEAVTGEQAFSGASLQEICAAVFETPPRRLRELDPELPEDFDRAVLRCLAKDPSRRYANVAALAEALTPFSPSARVYAERAQRVLAGIPLSGRPTPVPSDASFTLFVAPSEVREPPTLPTALRREALLRASDAAVSRTPSTTTRRWAIVLAALAGTLFGIAAWTVSSARGALEADAARRAEAEMSAPRAHAPALRDESGPIATPQPPEQPREQANVPPPTRDVTTTPSRPVWKAARPARAASKRALELPRVAASAGVPEPAAAPATPDASGVTDFGGRR